MGIKFNCQTCGKKLNVKGFLAGKRGICPHCGSKISIPGEGGAAASQLPEAGSALAAVASPVLGGGSAISGGGVATAVAMRAVPTGPAPAPSYTRPSVPISGGGNPGRPVAPAVVSVAPGAAPAGAPFAGAGDPISEAPQAVWYVRPASGGQFGPAAGEIMRRWISEGRVASDSLVWREGWPDWKPAASTFPSLARADAAESLAGGGNAFGLGGAVSGASTIPHRGRARRSNSMVVAMLVVLAVASVGLLVALIAVLGNW